MINTRVHRGSPDRFGYSWSIFSEILAEHREQFIRWTAALPCNVWKGAQILDFWLWDRSQHPLGDVGGRRGSGVAFDIDDRSLAAARKNLNTYPTINVRNQSIYDIPEENYFDIAFSIGVIHHLAEPEAALRQRSVQSSPAVMF